ncbi:rhodanese-like domain-containing protein [Maribacter sp. Asnod1-A12]|uniref:rhodanese-like domain-containing protein n=1 Tax=Maribacter sp. Asnod1-A12 TaxID=3160576 RepID=UPI00386CC86C
MKITIYKLIITAIILVSFPTISFGQDKISKTLTTLNKETIPYVYVDDLQLNDSIVLLDTRKKEEFQVSHLKNAMWVGYKKFDEEKVTNTITDKTQPIVVYCSIGVRSENIGEKLKDLGYTNILNLHGGIFEWKNKGNQVFNQKEAITDSVHTFNKHWSKLLHEGIKVY